VFSLLNFILLIVSYRILNNFLFIVSLAFMIKIGERIRNLRELSNLTQEELAERANLTKGFISQIERDLTSISLDSLIQILEAMDENLSDFFRETSEEKIVYREEDRVAIEKEKIDKFELLIPGSTNRRLEPILLTLRKGQTTPMERPHEGEEFGLVLQGRINLRYGKEVQKLKKGECFYFSAEKEHWLQNPGSKEAVILWISSPPSF
jgi:transcriptional regulator with XRE-family HTH domain